MSTAPHSPYAPDPVDETPVEVELGDLADVVVEQADWANREASEVRFRRVELRRCRLTGSGLGAAVLTDVTFDDCRLDLVNLRFATLERVAFRSCRMTECDFYEASLNDVLFDDCELRQASVAAASVQRVEVRGCDLSGVIGFDSLRSVRMPWNDVIANAALFATTLGIEIVE